jgi:hypothetical protein
VRHGIPLTRAAEPPDLLERDPAFAEADEVTQELSLKRQPVRLPADLYVLMIAVRSAEDASGLPYLDPRLLPEYV